MGTHSFEGRHATRHHHAVVMSTASGYPHRMQNPSHFSRVVGRPTLDRHSHILLRCALLLQLHRRSSPGMRVAFPGGKGFPEDRITTTGATADPWTSWMGSALVLTTTAGVRRLSLMGGAMTITMTHGPNAAGGRRWTSVFTDRPAGKRLLQR